jgi:acyl-CoA dehydrogenase
VDDPEVDAVYVATPPSSHREYTLLAARAGKPVYVEKPMAMTFAECEDMIAACKISVPLTVQNIVDRCMQMHGAGGLSRDYFLAEAFNYARWCRQADGPDQVHRMALGKQIIERYGD